jgi:3-keto-disaccharide hydrolase
MLKRFTVIIFVLVGLAGFSLAADENQNVCKGDPGKWQQLFNGKDLTGWKHVGPGSDTVEDGLIHTHGGMGLLYWTGGPIGNCEIHVVYRMRDTNDNSGVFIRIPVEPREEWMPVHYGFEVQIDNHPETSGEDEFHQTGMLYSLTKPLVNNAWKPGPEWNTMDITRRFADDRRAQRSESHGLQRWRPGAAAEVRFRAAARAASELRLVRAAESQRQ